MSDITPIISSPAMVNFSSVLTSVPNEIYVAKTDTPDSLASLMKNNVTIQFTLSPGENKIPKPTDKITTSVNSYFCTV